MEIHRHGNTPPDVDAQLFTILDPESDAASSFRQRYPEMTNDFDSDLEFYTPSMFGPRDSAEDLVLSTQYLIGNIYNQLTAGSGLTMSSEVVFNAARFECRRYAANF